jgi:hypothetical protein
VQHPEGTATCRQVRLVTADRISAAADAVCPPTRWRRRCRSLLSISFEDPNSLSAVVAWMMTSGGEAGEHPFSHQSLQPGSSGCVHARSSSTYCNCQRSSVKCQVSSVKRQSSTLNGQSMVNGPECTVPCKSNRCTCRPR